MQISIADAQPVDVERVRFEAVERKGIGHPDTLCDMIAERASRRYSLAVLHKIGRVPHHYFDKVMLMGGAARIAFGEGELIEPYRVMFAGKVTRRVGDLDLPVTEIITDATREVLAGTLRGFDTARDLVVLDELRDYQGPAKRRPRYRPERVADMPELLAPGRVSNDVNICTGYAPLSRVERLVLVVERYLNSAAFQVVHPYAGVDVKVAAVRVDDSIELTVNIPFIASQVSSMDAYRELSAALADDLRACIDEAAGSEIRLRFNPQDVSGLPYLTVTGSVADTGDVGVVGRGNRGNGLITPMRPMSIEAISGKSPIDNTGKLYGVVAERLSADIFDRTGQANATTIVTFRDRPLTDPSHVLVSTADPAGHEAREEIIAAVGEQIDRAPQLTEEIITNGVESW